MNFMEMYQKQHRTANSLWRKEFNIQAIYYWNIQSQSMTPE